MPMKVLPIRVVAALSLGLSPIMVFAGVPMDSFNSANAALVPGLAIERADKKPGDKAGAAQALVQMAEKRRRSVPGDAAAGVSKR